MTFIFYHISYVILFQNIFSTRMANKDAAFVFLIGWACIDYLCLNSVRELYNILKEISSLVVYHPSHDNEPSDHIHIFLSLQSNRVHQKVQIMLRQLDPVLKDHMKNRFEFNDYLKKVNHAIDFNTIEAVVASTFGYDGWISNATHLTENNDKINRIMLQRMSTVHLPLEIDCLSYCANAIMKRLPLNAGNFIPSYFGTTSGNNDQDTVVAPPSSEGIE